MVSDYLPEGGKCENLEMATRARGASDEAVEYWNKVNAGEIQRGEVDLARRLSNGRPA